MNEEEQLEEELGDEERQSESAVFQAGRATRGVFSGIGAGLKSLVGGGGEDKLVYTRPYVSRRAPAASAPVILVQGEPGSEEPESEPVDELADLFEVPQPEDNDIYTDDLLELDEEEGVGDLLTVSREDIINGGQAKPKPKVKLVRTGKPYYPGLTGLR